MQLGNNIVSVEQRAFSRFHPHFGVLQPYHYSFFNWVAVCPNRQLLFAQKTTQEGTLQLTWLARFTSYNVVSRCCGRRRRRLWTTVLKLHWSLTTSITCILTVINHNMMKFFWGGERRVLRTMSIVCGYSPALISSLHLIMLFILAVFNIHFLVCGCCCCWLCRWNCPCFQRRLHIN